MTAPLCPRCRMELDLAKYEGVVLRTCVRCDGFWLERGQLKAILALRGTFTPTKIRRAVKKSGKESEPVQLKPTLPCARCSNLMERFAYGGTSSVVLDRCPKHGAWFDAGELEDVRILNTHGKFGMTRREKEATVDLLYSLVGLLAILK